MNRSLCLLLALLLLLPLAAGCRSPETDGDAPPTLLQPEDLPSTRSTADLKEIYLSGKDSTDAILLKIPTEWQLSAKENGYTLLEGQTKIGSVVSGTINGGEMTPAKTTSYRSITTNISVGLLDAVPYYRIHLSAAGIGDLTVEIRQQALDAVALKQFQRGEITPITGYKNGASFPLDEGNDSNKILLLGNSFLHRSYSNISDILQVLLEEGEQDLEVIYASIGYASITQYATATTGSYPEIRAAIESGTYRAVLLCGLYYAEDVEGVAVLKELCDRSDTKLALLPAHNENATQISNAMKQYPDLPCLNWRAELNALIEQGVPREALVTEDQHAHSKPLAGYVGAHLIYRALYGAVPPALPTGCEAIDTAALLSLPDGYTTEGFRYIEEKNVYRLP